MINVGEIGPDVTFLINDSGGIVLRVAGKDAEVNSDALADALARSVQVAALMARSATPISGMSAPIERMLADRFGCTREKAA